MNELTLEKELTIDDLKTFIGTLKADLQNVKKGKQRTVFLNSILSVDSCYVNELMHATHFKDMFKKTKEKALAFLHNEEEREKAGWNYVGGKKSVLAENLKKQILWADQAYPNYTYDLWETEKDITSCVAFIKKCNT